MAGERRTYFAWHSWIGLTAGLLLFLVCWSGTMAVFSHELDWLADPRIRAPASEQIAWEEIHANARSERPHWKIAAIHAPIEPGFAAEVWVSDGDDVMHRMWADPGTGEVLGTTSYFNVQRFFRSFHMSLFIGEWRIWEIPLGYWLVGLSAFLLAASLVTSLLFYRRFWRGFFKLQCHKGAKVFWSDMHKLTGLWSLWFVALISITGIWYLAEWKVTSEAPFPEPPAAEGSVVRTLPLGGLVARAKQAYPELRIGTVSLASLDRGLFEVHGQDGAWLVRDRGARVWLDARDGSTVAIRRPGEMTLLHRWIDTADPLHFGNFGGLLSKTIWFVMGLGLSGLCLTGAYLQARRQQRRDLANYRRPVLAAYAATIAVLLAAGWFGYRDVVQWGRDGTLPAVPLATASFIATWTMTTLAILTVWMRVVR